MKALITFKYTDQEFETLKDLGYEIIFEDEKEVSFSKDKEDIDVMVCFDPFDRIDISQFPNLKWIQLLSAGVNQVPVDEVLNRNILITNNRGGYSIPISEWIVLKTLEMFNNSREFYKKQENKEWKMDTSLLEIYNKTVGFIGTGDIAKEAAKRFNAFGLKIIGINASGREAEHFHETYKVDQIHDIIGQVDILVVAAPYTEHTHHLINREVFNSMKDGAYLVNIARGSIIDEKALIENLKSKKIRKAALDVFEVEPLPKDNPLWDMDNVIISPHNSWASEMNFRRRYEIAYKNMKNYINNKEMVNVIDLRKGY